MPNILELIHDIPKDKKFKIASNFFRIRRSAKGYAPMLTQLLREYNPTGRADTKFHKLGSVSKRMLGKDHGGSEG